MVASHGSVPNVSITGHILVCHPCKLIAGTKTVSSNPCHLTSRVHLTTKAARPKLNNLYPVAFVAGDRNVSQRGRIEKISNRRILQRPILYGVAFVFARL